MWNRWLRCFAPINPPTYPAYPHHSEYANVPYPHPNEYVNVRYPHPGEYVNAPYPYPGGYINLPHPHPSEYVNVPYPHEYFNLPHPHPNEYINMPPRYANYPTYFDPMVYNIGHPGHEGVNPYNILYHPEAETTNRYSVSDADNEAAREEEQQEEINVVDVDEEMNVLDLSYAGRNNTVAAVQEDGASSSENNRDIPIAESEAILVEDRDENEIPLVANEDEENIIYIVRNGEIYCTKCMINMNREQENVVMINESSLEEQKALDLSQSALNKANVSSTNESEVECIEVNDSADNMDCL